jgi:hypothetical protein
MALALATAALGFATPAAAQDPAPLTRPDAIDQPVEDGCQRNPAGLLTFSSPEWVYVYAHEAFNPDPAKARVAEGQVAFSDTATGDLPQNHDFYDFNTDLDLDATDPDAPYGYLVGGDPDTHTGNFGEQGTLHIEWETGTLPPWDWATEGDHAKVWGSWVWDCGHWGQGFGADPNDPSGSIVNDTDYFLPGTNQGAALRGEGTEFHPMKAVVVTRDRPTSPEVGETETDAFISTDSTIAGAEGRCSLEHPAIVPTSYPPEWSACVLDASHQYQPVNDRDYTFFVPAPPKPSPDASLSVRVVDHDTENAPQEVLVPQADGVNVTVPFKDFGTDGTRMVFGKSVFVGWDGPVQEHAAKVDVELRRLTINNSLDDPDFGTSLGVPPGEWNLYSDINGEWKLLNDIVPGLSGVLTGQNLDLNHTFHINVADGDALRIGIDGRECDLPRIKPCPITSEVAEDNDSPGSAADDYASVADAIGDHTLTPDSGRWQLTYSVAQTQAAFKDPAPPAGDGNSGTPATGATAAGAAVTAVKVSAGKSGKRCKRRHGHRRRCRKRA